ncbi:hypothetical protein AGMMS49921_14090 [Endomicrobiia bacterium]|nr:hypothetical protein AGMMS49921_14090 [Endomicrobiia bacterium]
MQSEEYIRQCEDQDNMSVCRQCRRRILSVAASVVLAWTRKASEKIKLLKKEVVKESQ